MNILQETPVVTTQADRLKDFIKAVALRFQGFDEAGRASSSFFSLRTPWTRITSPPPNASLTSCRLIDPTYASKFSLEFWSLGHIWACYLAICESICPEALHGIALLLSFTVDVGSCLSDNPTAMRMRAPMYHSRIRESCTSVRQTVIASQPG